MRIEVPVHERVPEIILAGVLPGRIDSRLRISRVGASIERDCYRKLSPQLDHVHTGEYPAHAFLAGGVTLCHSRCRPSPEDTLKLAKGVSIPHLDSSILLASPRQFRVTDSPCSVS